MTSVNALGLSTVESMKGGIDPLGGIYPVGGIYSVRFRVSSIEGRGVGKITAMEGIS